MSERERLAPCPLCDGNAYFDECNPAECDGVCTVRCINCGLALPIFRGPLSKDSAIAAWNRRAAPPVPQDVARLIADIRAHAKRIDGTAEHAISAAFLIDGADALAALAAENARLRAKAGGS